MFFGKDRRGVFFRLAHVTSSRFVNSIHESGLMMANTLYIRNSMIFESGLTNTQGLEAIKRIKNHSFGRVPQSELRARGIYFYPVTQHFSSIATSIGSTYHEGGKYFSICRNAIDETCKKYGIKVPPRPTHHAIVVIVKFYLYRDAISFFERIVLNDLLDDYKRYKSGDNYQTQTEFIIKASIPSKCIEKVLDVKAYQVWMFGL